jgi:hypothetical protein
LPLPTGEDGKATSAAVADRANTALAAQIDPASSDADAIHDELVARFAAAVGRTPDEAYRRELLDVLRTGNEPRAERYWQLIAIINGWPPFPSFAPAWAWFTMAIAARIPA